MSPLPSLTRMMAFVFVADTVSNFLLFAPVFILTEGGPSNSTNLLMYYAYAHAFADNELGSRTGCVYYPPDRRHWHLSLSSCGLMRGEAVE